MKISFLGTGASHSRGQRLNTSLALSTDHGHLLVDCSGFPEHALARQNIEITDITHVFLTHPHMDHLYALPSLIQVLRLRIRSGETVGPLHLHGTSATLERAREIISGSRVQAHAPRLTLHLRETLPDRPLAIGSEIIHPFPVDHAAGSALGFRLKIPRSNRYLIYSGDTRPCPELARKVDARTLLIHECCGMSKDPHHTSGPQLADLLADHPPARLVLVHLPALSGKTKQEMDRMLSTRLQCPVTVPEDGDRLEL